MSFTYDGTVLTTDLAKVRMALGDTSSATGEGIKPSGENFTDEELAVFIDATETWRSAVVQALRVLANLYAAAARSIQFADFKEDFTAAASEYRQQAKAWEATLDNEGAVAALGFAVGKVTMNELYYTVNSDGTVT